MLRPTLTPEECHIICEYLATMSRDNHQWSSHFKSTVSSQVAPKNSRRLSSSEGNP